MKKNTLEQEMMKTKKKMKRIDYILDHFETLSAINLTVASVSLLLAITTFYSSILAGVILSGFTAGLFGLNLFKNKIEMKLNQEYNDADQKLEIFESDEAIDLEYLTEGYDKAIEKAKSRRLELIEEQSYIAQSIRGEERLIERLIKEKQFTNEKIDYILTTGIANDIAKNADS
ncbi:MAG: hypothetical protein ACLRFL_03610, partial [Clostridia bacterium]